VFKQNYHSAFLGIGSNIGNRLSNIKKAIHILRKTEGIKVKKVSTIYQTNPKGGPPQRRFLNGAIKINTSLTSLSLLNKLKEIEKTLGRKKTMRFGPRIIDLDILLYGDEKINRKDLQIPHPRMHKRSFVLKPLKEIL
jgi:2-amino-4-hydroxy-6-hydroxymethyldihydropteridine diphosphokinase